MSYFIVFIIILAIFSLNPVAVGVSLGPFIMEVYGIQERVILFGIIGGVTRISGIINTVSAFIFSLNCGKDKECLKSKYKIMYIICGYCCVISSFLLFFETKDKYPYEDIPVVDNDLINKDEHNKILEMKDIKDKNEN